MKPIKKNDAYNYESIKIKLSRMNTPIAYQNKLDEALLNQESADADDKIDIFLSIFIHTSSFRYYITNVFMILLQTPFLIRYVRIAVKDISSASA